MSVSSVGATSTDQAAAYAANQQRLQAFKKLSSSIQSEDLADAQKALATLQQGAPGGPLNALGQNSTIKTDFDNLASALNSGNTADAQKALATLQQDMQKVHGHRHGGHHGGGGSQSAVATQTIDSTTEPSTASEAVGSLVNIQA